MRRILAVLLPLILGHPLAAQEDKHPDGPVLEVSFEKTETVPGQPLSLRLTVLAPTFLPAPPVWPSFEAPNLLVRLPERSTGPTSKRVGGETWSGITRNYRIAPMVPGKFTLPRQEVIVVYADPETSRPVKVKLTTEPIAFTGAVPEGAEGLQPFIAARSLELKQRIEGKPEAMKPGDSVVRTVTATVRGVSPMFLTDLLPAKALEGVAAYPDEPAVDEAEDRGVPGGTRTERVTLVAEGGGSGELPPVTLQWFNLATGQVETAKVAGVAVKVDGPPARSIEPRDWRAIGLAAVAGALALAFLAWLLRRILPPLARWVRGRRERWLASEAHAYGRLRRVTANRDHAALRPALDGWAGTVAGADPRHHPGLNDALTEIGAALYGRQAPGDVAAAWRALQAALPKARRTSRARASVAALPPLNPGASLARQVAFQTSTG